MSKNIGHIIHTFDQLESTNNYAMGQMRHNDMRHGEIVWAKHQLAGKGQRGNVWESNAGENLLFSIILRPDFIALKDQSFINEIISVALHEYLTVKGIGGVQIKYPNDILVNGDKIAGMLTECSTIGSTLEYAVVGIGLNVNQESFNVEGRRVVSMKNFTNILYDLNTEIEVLLQIIEKYYSLASLSPSPIKEKYKAHLLSV